MMTQVEQSAIQLSVQAKDIGEQEPSDIRFTVGTLITDTQQYDRMLQSFSAYGFTHEVAEFLYVDNRKSNRFDAYRGLNMLLAAARGTFVILCHQDVELIGDGQAQLEQKLAQLTSVDPNWAVAGNSGGVAPGVRAIRISDPIGEDQFIGTLPAKVESLDENFIVIRRAAMIGFSRNINGFHFYGTDICQQARLRGWNSWVIDFHLRHHSRGNLSAAFYENQSAFEQKYRTLSKALPVQTSCAEVMISGSLLDRTFWEIRQLFRRNTFRFRRPSFNKKSN